MFFIFCSYGNQFTSINRNRELFAGLHSDDTTSACCVPPICENCLTSDPSAFGAEEFDNWCDIFHISKTSLHSIALMVSYCFWRFLRIEECCSIVSVSETPKLKNDEMKSGMEQRDLRVSIGPGAIAFTDTLLLLSSFETPRVKCSTGALDPAYEV